VNVAKPKDDFNLTAFIEIPRLLHVMTDDKKKTYGVTVLGNELFLVRSTSHVYVYDCRTFKSTRKLLVPDSVNLRSIVACQHSNCLYVNDFFLRMIFKVDHLMNVVIRSWSVKGLCFALSITKSYSVLVTLYDCKQMFEYKEDGSVIRIINFPMGNPTHCIQLSNDLFVVGHSKCVTNQRQVCIMDKDGHILRSHDLSVRLTSEHLEIAVDSHGYVIVAEYYDHRVELLSPTLTHLGYIQKPGHKIMCPMALHFDELNHRLYIGQVSCEYLFVLEADVSVINSMRAAEGINNQEAWILFYFISQIYITIILSVQSRLKAIPYLKNWNLDNKL